MARERNTKRREGNEIEFARIVAFSDGVFAIAITLLVLPVAFVAPGLAPLMWLALFFDPAARFAGADRSSKRSP